MADVDKKHGGGEIILGMVLTIFGAATLALAMVLQRYALSYPESRVPFLGRRWPRLVVWFMGLMAYAVANGLYAAALNFGPLSLLACIFTLLLVFNMIFARWLLEEALTPPKVIGCFIILLGVGCVVVAAAKDAPNDFSPDDIKKLLERAAGVTYLSVLIAIVIVSVGGILWYDCRYSAIEGQVQPCGSDSGVKNGQSENRTVPPAADMTVASENVDRTDSSAEGASDAKMRRKPPSWLDNMMGLVYPGSLGIDEGIAHLTMKGSLAMISDCSGLCDEGVFWLFFVIWIAASVATAWWLKVVFARYETTSALPIEYGTVNLASVCSGLIFYSEADYMTTWQVVLSLVGLVLILSGIQCSRLASLPFTGLQKAAEG